MKAQPTLPQKSWLEAGQEAPERPISEGIPLLPGNSLLHSQISGLDGIPHLRENL